MDIPASVLIVDDDPAHLKIYGWLVEKAGYRALTAEVRFTSIDLPPEPADMVLLDYHLGGQIAARDVAIMLRARLPDAPVILLSDVFSLPEDIAPLVQGFVRKGNPARLIQCLQEVLPPTPPADPAPETQPLHP
jgi:CheY-like chemotaxis protein